MFHELEDEPESLLGSATNLAALVTGGGEAAPDDEPLQQQRAAQLPEQQAQRVVLLFRPARRFVRPAARTPKLLGMVQVLLVALGLTAGFYVAVGLCGFLSFPDSAKSNILLNYPGG